MTDQTSALCQMLTGSIGKAEQNDALRRMTSGAQHGQKEIKVSDVLPWQNSQTLTRSAALLRDGEQHCQSRVDT